MARLARRVLKLILFVVIFCLFSRLDVRYLSINPIPGNESSIKVAHWLSSSPTPEDIYSVNDYLIIIINLLASAIGYNLAMCGIRKFK